MMDCRVKPGNDTVVEQSRREGPMTHHHLRFQPRDLSLGLFRSQAETRPHRRKRRRSDRRHHQRRPRNGAGPQAVSRPARTRRGSRQERGTVPGHILTGPVAVDGAEPGDMLEVGSSTSRPAGLGLNLSGRWPARCPRISTRPQLINIPLDRERIAGCPGGPSSPQAVFRRDGRGAAARLGPITSLIPRAMAAISTTRSWCRRHTLSAGVGRAR